MSTFKTEAVVLAKRPFIEHDRFYTIYTKNYGKLEVLVKAAAKSSSKLAGHLEPFSLSRLMIARGRRKETVAGAELLATYSFADLASYALASLAGEVLIKMTKPGVGDERIYDILLKLLSFLSEEGMLEIKRLANLKYLWLLLKFSGYQPDLKTFSGIQNLPKLSLAAQTFLAQLISGEPAFNISKTVIKEIESYTKYYLEYILESDLKSLPLLFYA